MKKVLYLVRGCPGAGKTTLAETLAGDEWPILAADDYHTDENGVYNFVPANAGKAHFSCQMKCKHRMRKGIEKIFVTNTFINDNQMKPYFEMAEKYGYDVFTMVVENRHGNKSIHDVPDSAVEDMKKSFTVTL
jgi:NEDD4-binding protein 2